MAICYSETDSSAVAEPSTCVAGSQPASVPLMAGVAPILDKKHSG